MTIQPWDLINGDFQEHLTKLCLEAPLPGKANDVAPAFEQETQKGERAA